MQIVLPGALPDPREARELTSYLQNAAPTLVRWLEQGRARTIAADPASSGCTPHEQWLLAASGFKPRKEQNLSAGLAPLWLQQPVADNTSVWLTELVHVSPSRDGAALLPARELAITREQSVALFESAQPLFADSGFTLHADSIERWRLELPAGFAPQSASPALVSISTVNDWWPQDVDARPWRRLVNELQMAWFEHPVNQTRYRQSLVPINSLWLFGGASAEQLTFGKDKTSDAQTHDALLAPATSHDWGGWLAALQQLEAAVFKPLAGGPTPGVVLMGTDRIVEVQPMPWGQWIQWLPGSRLAWRKWWSPQN
ncbi:hypothetical protein CR155_11675 [Pollutimonas nitritireducens]|uniref:Regulatory protein, RpfE type n=1 Tax=Pollutimonas nitritireducens TaxID=2045209 RepID=A0A2N4UEP5_9BURK|nr:hypothetical protein [Pollutimonas nitritireducens]PLC53492.1 hypothetical protein CR155_11675 [Pollutimonas nitritireducens]